MTPKYRWLVLWYSIFAVVVQGYLWSFWGAIAHTLTKVFGFSASTILILSNYMIVPVVLGPLNSHVLEKFGPKKVNLGCCGLMLVGCLMRCVPTTDFIYTVLCHISALLCCLPTVLFGGSIQGKVAVVWFEPEERPLAASLSMSMNYGGTILSFLTGAFSFGESKAEKTQRYFILTWAQTAITALAFLGGFFLLPDRPSGLEGYERIDEEQEAEEITETGSTTSKWEEFKSASSSRKFWIWQMQFVLTMTLPVTLCQMLNLLLTPLGVSQINAGWIGLSAAVGSLLFGAVVGVVANRFYRGQKAIIATIHGIGTLAALWYALSTIGGLVPTTTWSLGLAVSIAFVTSVSLGGLLLDCAIAESVPISEEYTSTSLSVLSFIFPIILLAASAIDSQHFSYWASWVLFASKAIVFVTLFFIRIAHIEPPLRKFSSFKSYNSLPDPGPDSARH